MRVANAAGRLAVVTADGLVDVETASAGRFGPDPQAVYERWSEFVEWAATGVDGTPAQAIDRTRLGPPVPRPNQVFAVGLNYLEHAREAGFEQPAQPMIFTKFQSSLAGPHGTVVLPADTVDWEVELVAVIGQRCSSVGVRDAWSVIAGLTVGQDLSERTLQFVGDPAQFSLGKSYPGFGPLGPYLVTPDELADREDLLLVSRLNGEVVQSGRTSQMMFSVAELIARLSAVCTLHPGDLIFTGTPPGVGMGRVPPRYLVDGDVLESYIEGIGGMVHQFVGAPVPATSKVLEEVD